MLHRDFKRAYEKVFDNRGNLRDCSIESRLKLVEEYNKLTNNKITPGTIPNQMDLVEMQMKYRMIDF